MFKVSLAATLPRSLAVPRTEIVPTLVDVGVPLKVRVEGLKESQEGKAEPLAVIAARCAYAVITARFLRGGPRTESSRS